MKKHNAGIATLAFAFFLAVQFFAPQGTMADSEGEINKDRSFNEFRGPARLSQLTGATLKNFDDEELGKVEDLVFKEGNIQYVIVSVGGVMGFGNRLIPVPWGAVKARQGEDADARDADVQDAGNEFYVDMKRDQFLRSPSFARDNWPTFTNPNLDATVDQYFQVNRD
jgi:hypothetical protein